jgi:hypothetical protein
MTEAKRTVVVHHREFCLTYACLLWIEQTCIWLGRIQIKYRSDPQMKKSATTPFGTGFTYVSAKLKRVQFPTWIYIDI